MAHYIEDIDRALNLRVVRKFEGGEFGATLVADARGVQMVLKAIRSRDFLVRVETGARMAGQMRARGYPAPEYLGTGVELGMTWSLQTVLPGEIPDVLERGFAEQLLALAERHKDAAGEDGDWLAGALKNARRAARSIQQHPDAPALAAEASVAVQRCAKVELGHGDVVHGDFHHRNFLAVGDTISGVFDWELSTPGDWRVDVATLAFWSKIVPSQIRPTVAAIVEERLHGIAEPEIVALFGACLALNIIEFDQRVHPERLADLLRLLEEHIAPWWRAVL